MEAIIFESYILVCAALFKSRFSRSATVFALTAAGVVIMGVNIAVMLSSMENLELMLTLFPLTAYLPFSVLLYFLSDGGIFETSAVFTVGTLEALILKSLQKILTKIFLVKIDMETSRYVLPIIISAVVALAAALVFVTFKFIVKPFRLCVVENSLNHRNRLLLLVPTALVFLMVFYFLNSMTNIPVLFLTMLIAVSVFFIISKLLGTAAEVIRMKRSEQEMSEYMELQRHSYEKPARKMEAGRAYRHNMRHHLRIIEGLAKQGDCDRIIEYTGKMNGSLGELKTSIAVKIPR